MRTPTLEAQYNAAKDARDWKRARELLRTIRRMDAYRQAYGREQRGRVRP